MSTRNAPVEAGPDQARPGGPTSPAARPGVHHTGRRRRVPLRTRLRRDWQLLAMVAPGFVILLVFSYVPILGNVIAFQDYNPYLGSNPLEAFLHSDWIGFGQFQLLFEDPAFWDAFRNTLAITAFQLVFFFPLPIVLAIMLHNLLSS
ncbi:sugar ABC transporter permease, partial [Micromonospora sp. NPDC051296]